MTTIGHNAKDGADVAGAAVDPGHLLVAPLFEAFCRFFFKRAGTLTVTFEAPLPDGPFMVCANHRSHVDSLVLMAASGLTFGQCGLLAAEDYYFRHPARLRIVSSVLRLIPVERRPTATGFAATLAACSRFLKTGGRMLIAYPEGTRNPGPTPARFKRGPATLALRFNLDVVPAFVTGTERVLPKGRAVPRPAGVAVRFGAPLVARPVLGPAAVRHEAAYLTESLAERVRRLAGP